MASQSVFHRRGSNTGTGGSVLSPPANSVVNNSHVAGDEFQPALLIQCQPPAGSSSPGPHHPPPQSLNLLAQQQSQVAGAQIKKKSGFQITSVTPAQISVSTNNSIAEDTESYDDLDESHTEDLSSSEILDVSLSRANDVVGAERSSSEETLNNFHEAETPGAVSPNQPAHPHSLHPASQHGGAMVNGSVHHHHHHQHQHHKQPQVYAVSGAGHPSSAGALPNVTLKMPSKVGAAQESVSQAVPPGVGAPALGVMAPGSVAGMHGSAAGTTVSIVNPQSSSVGNVNLLSSANVPVRGGICTSACSSTSGFPLNVMSNCGANLTTNVNANIQQQQSIQNSNITMTSTAAAPSASVGMGGVQARVGPAVPPVSAPNTAPPQSAPAHPTTAPAATTSSRFRVVKLDSSSEPFKKGRWTCTEFYDKETPASAPSSSASDSSSVSARQYLTESFTAPSERETTSGSSVSSSMSTLSHYTDSLCSGESSQHPQDYTSPPQAFQSLGHGAVNHLYPQDVGLSQVKTTAPQTNMHAAASMGTSAVPPQQLTYAQAVASQVSGPAPGLPQPQLYPPTQQPAPVPGQVMGSANAQMMGAQTVHHPQPLKPTALQPPSVPPHVGTMGTQCLIDAPQQKPQSLPTQIQTANMAPTVHQVSAPAAPPHTLQTDPQTAAPAGGTGVRPVTQNLSIAQAHAAQASALYASLPSFTTTQLQDAQRLLLQHQSALLGLPKGLTADTGATAASGQEAEGNAAASALTTSTKTVDGEDEG